MAISKFKANFHRQSVYACSICNHQTRDTGLGEQNCGLCAACYDLCGIENSMSDDGLEETLSQAPEVRRLIAVMKKRSTGAASWESTFSQLLAVEAARAAA